MSKRLLLLSLATCCYLNASQGIAQNNSPRQPPSPAPSPASTTRSDTNSNGDSAADSLAVLFAAETAVQRAIERAAPSVVAIGRYRREKAGHRDGPSEFNFNLPGIGRPLANMLVNDALPTEFGSGVIISEDGAILTCYHVIDDPDQNDYYVWLSPEAADRSNGASKTNGAGAPIPATVVRKPATVKAGDPWTDLAVLKVDLQGLSPMPMGDAGKLRRGSFVVSLGNPYATARDGMASASWGLVSNLQRRAPRMRATPSEANPAETLQEFGTLIQTDASLNLGTSGGALINMQGEMIGLTTSLAAVAGFEQAAGYAIPMDGPTIQSIAELQEGRLPAFGFLGVEPFDAGNDRGALVRRVVPGMAGDNAGLRSGDLIVGVDGQRIGDAEALFREMSRRPADSDVKLNVYSPSIGSERTLIARLGKKRLALSRPAYSELPEPSWRGMSVDFASALPPNRLMRTNLAPSGEAAVVRVDPDTPAWRAGARPGQVVMEVNGKRIERPEDFYATVEAATGEVTLVLANMIGVTNTIRVGEPIPAPAGNGSSDPAK